MPNKLTIFCFAAALAFPSGSAVAVEMPSYGSKNFSTPGDAPSYFTNENGGVSGRGVDTAAIDASADETAAPTSSEAEPVETRTKTGHRGRHASSQTLARHASGTAKARGGSTHYAKLASAKPVKTASLARPAGAGNKAAASIDAKGTTKALAASSPKTKMAKPAKANLRHAVATGVTNGIAAKA
jgi:hypothetical protein